MLGSAFQAPSVVHAPSGSTPKANRVGGKTFASPASFAAYLKKSGNDTVSLFPGQSFTINTQDSKTLGYVNKAEKSAFFTVTTDKQFPNSNVIITVDGTAKAGQSDKVSLDIMGLYGSCVSNEPVESVAFTLSILPL